jgi:transposase
MDPLYVGFDIHEKTLTGTAMDKQGIVEFSGTIRNTREAVQCFLSGIPSPHVRIAIEACGLWRGVYTMLTQLGYQVVLAQQMKVQHGQIPWIVLGHLPELYNLIIS